MSASSIRIFVSSVQKELELERAAIASLITTDPFLLQHCLPVLFEKEPPSARPAPQGYLHTLRGCGLYVLIVANEYGQLDGDLSATHHEYREARKLKLPTIVFLKGKDDTRSAEAREFIAEIKRDGYKYVRFHDREDLKPLMLDALRRVLAEEFSIQATPAEVTESRQLIDAASTFETTVLREVTIDSLDQQLIERFNQALARTTTERIWRDAGEALVSRGLAVPGKDPGLFLPTTASVLLFGAKPADRFPQCELLVDAYDETRITGRPRGQESFNAPIPYLLEQAIDFVDRYTMHPRRVVGLNNIRLDEYPTAALRETLVNAVAHRSYDDRARKVFVRVFSDRIEVASPGYPPQPLTLAKLRKGDYRPCSRNPLIAQTLATLGAMEQRGSGFARMRDAMLNHGLDAPELAQQDGFFVVTLRGPAGDFARLRVPADAQGLITPAIAARLNKRQKAIMTEVQRSGAVTSGWCRRRFGVTYNTAFRDFSELVALKLLVQHGQGRGTKYVLPSA